MAEKIYVLLVDDEVAFTSTLAKRLTRRGMNVSTAGHGDEAYALMARKYFDVVVLDMNMPGIDGVQLFKTIRQQFSNVKVVFLSGEVGVEGAVRMFSAGAFDYLFKGSSTKMLEQRIRDAAESRQTTKKQRCSAFMPSC